MFSTDDSIVAIATPPGRGGIGIVRISGPAAPAIAADVLERRVPLAPRHATCARVRVDEVVASTWSVKFAPAPVRKDPTTRYEEVL